MAVTYDALMGKASAFADQAITASDPAVSLPLLDAAMRFLDAARVLEKLGGERSPVDLANARAVAAIIQELQEFQARPAPERAAVTSDQVTGRVAQLLQQAGVL